MLAKVNAEASFLSLDQHDQIEINIYKKLFDAPVRGSKPHRILPIQCRRVVKVAFRRPTTVRPSGYNNTTDIQIRIPRGALQVNHNVQSRPGVNKAVVLIRPGINRPLQRLPFDEGDDTRFGPPCDGEDSGLLEWGGGTTQGVR